MESNWTVLGFLIMCIYEVGLNAPACDTTQRCDCCYLKDSCLKTESDWCEGPCIDGFWGARCIRSCPSECVSCDQTYGVTNKCHACVDGKYGLKCSISCSEGCATCSKTEGSCTGCKPGYYGLDFEYPCEYPCPANCKDKRCNATSGNCYACDENYYGVKCLCSNNCELCDELSGNCKKCKAGYFGISCANTCSPGCRNIACNFTSGFCFPCNSSFYGDTCNKTCSNNCLNNSCDMSIGECYQCKPRYFGENCQYNCSSYCKNGVCNKTSGNCNECIHGYRGDMCNETCAINCFNHSCDRHSGECLACINGLFGDKCGKNCSNNCNNGTCNKTSGVCNECKDGLYGTFCNLTCPVNCDATSCDRETGECMTCASGFYGRFCNMTCSVNCESTTCDRTTGNCKACSPGFYGRFCDQNCSVHCNNSVCDQHVGACDECTDDTYGPFCNMTCPGNCDSTSCDRYTGECTACSPGFYGKVCNVSCSANCEKYICELETGKCKACIPGFYGQFCDRNCSVHCNNYGCDQVSATCFECIVGRFGNVCSNVCPSNCNRTICNQSSGDCLYGCNANFRGDTCVECVVGTYGQHCNLSCSTFCNNSECHKENGTCTDGCISSSSDLDYCCVNNTNCNNCSSPNTCMSCAKGKYGASCETECPANCIDTCDKDSGYCDYCNASQYGDKCQYNCSDTCIVPHNETRSCFRRNGTCIHGCIDLYYGDQCQSVCSSFCEGTCEPATGYCVRCRNNKYGLFCNVNCPWYCLVNEHVSTMCFQLNGSCAYGCENGYYGTMCALNCSSGCNDSCHQFSGECIGGCIVGFTGDYCLRTKAGLGVDDSGSSVVAVSVAVSVVTVCIAVIIAGVFIFIRKRRRESTRKHIYLTPNNSNRTKSQPSVNHVYQNTVFAGHFKSSDKDDEQTLDISSSQEQIVIQDLTVRSKSDSWRSRTVEQRTWETLSKPDDVLQEEFMALPNGLIKSYGDSRQSENISKNRYKMIYPYDETRVKLYDEDSDYINASYIHGIKRDCAYIAALGPTRKTLGDDFHMFWKMVWQEKVEIIVMLTKLVEITGMKCDQYWPNRGTTTEHCQLTVRSVSEEYYAEFVVRNLTLSKNSEQRQLRHVHFTAWPDKGVPSDVISINNLRHKVVNIRKAFDGPLLVHCSAGIGRTGTYIALDILTENGVLGESLDVFECVNNMRQQRVNMVQTLDQYKYLHHAVLWSLTSDTEPIPAERFMDLSWLYESKRLAELQKQLQIESFYDTDEVQEAIAENKAVPFANRHGTDIPGFRNTVFLFTNDDNGFDRSTYFNAVFVDGYRKQNRFIAAQTPLPETVSNFLDMILQENVTCIVDLTPIESQEDVGEYLPVVDQEIHHNNLVFRVTNREDRMGYTKQEVGIYEQDNMVQTIHHFKFNKWDDGEIVPESPEEFLQLVNDVEKLVIKNDMSGPIIVHCLTGAVNSGLFCAVWVLTERIGTDFQASVLNTLGQIKTRRRMAFQNEEQIAFCFECVAAHLKNLDQHVYSNMVLNN